MKTEELKALLGCMDAEVNGIWPLEYEDSYFVPSPVSITGWALLHWNDSTFDRRMLDARIVFTKAEDAQKLLQLQLKAPELAAEVIQLRESQRWIPVSERLPEYNEPVLVFCADAEYGFDGYKYTVASWMSKEILEDIMEDETDHVDSWCAEVGMFNGDYGSMTMMEKVTHWMPLPDFSQGKSHEN